MSVEAFIEAGESLMICELIDSQGRKRIVEPYMVYHTSTGKYAYHCFQLSGYSFSGNTYEWKNPLVDSISSVKMLDESFEQRREYNPFNFKKFPRVTFSVPTAIKLLHVFWLTNHFEL